MTLLIIGIAIIVLAGIGALINMGLGASRLFNDVTATREPDFASFGRMGKFHLFFAALALVGFGLAVIGLVQAVS